MLRQIPTKVSSFSDRGFDYLGVVVFGFRVGNVSEPSTTIGNGSSGDDDRTPSDGVRDPRRRTVSVGRHWWPGTRWDPCRVDTVPRPRTDGTTRRRTAVVARDPPVRRGEQRLRPIRLGVGNPVTGYESSTASKASDPRSGFRSPSRNGRLVVVLSNPVTELRWNILKLPVSLRRRETQAPVRSPCGLQCVDDVFLRGVLVLP